MQDADTFELSDEMKANYINRRIEELDEFKKKTDSQTVQFAQEIGHKIAGTAQSYGFSEFESIAKNMERLRPTEIDNCRKLIDSLNDCVIRARQKMETKSEAIKYTSSVL
jgi:HPt (histidine-containing phosphotransfer) domain-containing protein